MKAIKYCNRCKGLIRAVSSLFDVKLLYCVMAGIPADTQVEFESLWYVSDVCIGFPKKKHTFVLTCVLSHVPRVIFLFIHASLAYQSNFSMPSTIYFIISKQVQFEWSLTIWEVRSQNSFCVLRNCWAAIYPSVLVPCEIVFIYQYGETYSQSAVVKRMYGKCCKVDKQSKIGNNTQGDLSVPFHFSSKFYHTWNTLYSLFQ